MDNRFISPKRRGIYWTNNNYYSRIYWFDLAKRNENRILYGILSEYICFDTGLLSFEGEPIYFLAKKNYREKPEWVLVGVSTVNSKVLGEVIRKEFKL